MQGDITKQMSLYSAIYNEIDQNHLLKRVEKKLDLSFIQELIGHTYSKNLGRISFSPEVLFRLILVEYIYGYSDNKVIEMAKNDIAIKYFTTLNPEDALPSASALKNFRAERFKDIDIDKIVYITLKDLIDEGVVTLKKSYSKKDKTDLLEEDTAENTEDITEDITYDNESDLSEKEDYTEELLEFKEKQLDFFKDYTVNVLSNSGIDIYLPLNQTFKDISIHNFYYNPKEGVWMCSRNNKSVKTNVKYKRYKDGVKIFINYYFDKYLCSNCIRKSRCIKNKFCNRKVLTVLLDTRNTYNPQ